MTFQHMHTFLRSSLAKDPYCLGDLLGPEDVLRIEAQFPELFDVAVDEKPISEIKTDERKPVTRRPVKHDCLNKPPPPKPSSFSSVNNRAKVATSNINRHTSKISSNVSFADNRKSFQGSSRPEMKKNISSSRVTKAPITLKELKATLSNILSRVESELPLTQVDEESQLYERKLGESSQGEEKAVMLKIDMEKVAQARNSLSIKNPPSKSLPTLLLSTQCDFVDTDKIGVNAAKKHYRKRPTAYLKQNQSLHENLAVVSSQADPTRSGLTKSSPGPGYIRHTGIPKARRAMVKNKSGSRAKSGRKSKDESLKVENGEEGDECQIPLTNKVGQGTRRHTTKDVSSPELSDSLTLSILDNPVTAQQKEETNGQFHFRKSDELLGKIEVQENVTRQAVSQFEQLLLAKTLASKYEQCGKFQKHRTFVHSTKKSYKEPAPTVQNPTRVKVPQSFSKSYQQSTLSSRKVLEQIAGELIYMEVLKHLHSEQEQRRKVVKKDSIVVGENAEAKNSPPVVGNNVPAKKVNDSPKPSQLPIGLTTISEESEIDFNPPDPPSQHNNQDQEENEPNKQGEKYPIPSSKTTNKESTNNNNTALAAHPQHLPERDSSSSSSTKGSLRKVSEKSYTMDFEEEEQVSLNRANELDPNKEGKSLILEQNKEPTIDLVTPEGTPVKDTLSPSSVHNSLSKNVTKSKTSKKIVAEHSPNINEATDCSELSDFITDNTHRTDEGEKSSVVKGVEQLLTPCLSNHSTHDHLSIAEKESSHSCHRSNKSSALKKSPSKKDAPGSPNDSQNNNTTIKIVNDNLPSKPISIVDFKPPKSTTNSKSDSQSQKLAAGGVVGGADSILVGDGSGVGSTHNKNPQSSTFDSPPMSETEDNSTTGTVTTSTNNIFMTSADILSEGEYVGKRHKSPGELSASFQYSPGVRPAFSASHSSCSDEDIDTLSEGVEVEFSRGEIGGGRVGPITNQ